MNRYNEVYDSIYVYFENMLINEGANTWDDYKDIVGNNVGPYDKELWDLLVKLEEYKTMGGVTK